MYTPENLKELLGKRFNLSHDSRTLFLYYSKVYNMWGIYFVASQNTPYHSSLEHVSAEKICEFLNGYNHEIIVLPGYFG